MFQGWLATLLLIALAVASRLASVPVVDDWRDNGHPSVSSSHETVAVLASNQRFGEPSLDHAPAVYLPTAPPLVASLFTKLPRPSKRHHRPFGRSRAPCNARAPPAADGAVL